MFSILFADVYGRTQDGKGEIVRKGESNAKSIDDKYKNFTPEALS
jgi:hypothetical protein